MSCDSTVLPSTGRTSNRPISVARPSSITPSSTPRATSARWARRTRGSSKLGTAFAIASTPVSAAQPLENALSSNRIPMVRVSAATAGPVSVTTGAERSSPVTITTRMPATNITVGAMNTRALSRIPARFNAVTPVSTARQIHTV